MKAPYDFLIVGSGLYGAVFAREMTNIGRKFLVIDKRAYVGVPLPKHRTVQVTKILI
jgi:UDP-galactopyranose mutase